LSLSLKEKNPQDFVHPTSFANLFVVPSNNELGEIEHLLESKHKIYKLRGLLKSLEKDFDAIYVDTPPAWNFYTLSALIACDRCLIPFDCDAFSRQALYTLLANIREATQDHNEDLEVEGIIVNQFQPRARLPQQLVDELKEEGMPLLDTFLSSSVIMRESHDRNIPLVNLAPRHKLTEQFRQLYQDLAR
jgi:chromosome partitioning protein